MGRFDGKVAIITGSSNGIGRATAVLFVKEGAKVTITGRDVEALKVTKSECLKAGGKEGDIVEVIGDITHDDVQKKLISETLAKFGKLDILVNNHGGARDEHDKEGNLDLSSFDGTFDQNLKSVIGMCEKAMPHLKASKGEVVNVSSAGSHFPVQIHPFYAISKAALEHFTRILAYKHAQDGVRVNTVSPGIIKTKFFNKLGMDDKLAEKLRNGWLEGIPMKRIGTPEDIAEPIAFLADRHASGYMTGQVIFADGGILLEQNILTIDAAKVLAER